MEKSIKTIVAIMAVVIFGILLSIPAGLLMEKQSFASTEKVESTVGSVAESDYIFVVLEDDAVPLAAAPVSGSFNPSVVVAVVIALLMVSAVSYSYWYLMTRTNISAYSYAVTNNELSRIIPSKSFLHPIELSNAEREILFRAAAKGF